MLHQLNLSSLVDRENIWKEKRLIRRGSRLKRQHYSKVKFVIDISNIRHYIPVYNILLHIALSMGSAGIVAMYAYTKANLFIALMAIPIGFMLPLLLLQLIADAMEYRFRKYYINFLITYNYYYKNSNNIFEAFRRASPFFVEPIKGYIDQMLDDYKDGIKPEKCLEELRKRIHNRQIKTFFRSLEINYRKGGDTLLLIEKTIRNLRENSEIYKKQEAEISGLKIGMYFVLFANFGLLNYMLSGGYREMILNTWWGNGGITLNLLMALFVIQMIMQQGHVKEVKESYEHSS